MLGRTADCLAVVTVVMLLLTTTSGLRFRPRVPVDEDIKKFEQDMMDRVAASLAELKNRPQMDLKKALEEPEERTVEEPVETPMSRLEKLRAELKSLEKMQEPVEKGIFSEYNYRRH